MDNPTKNRFDALMKLAQFNSDVREKRREIEWKVSIGIWTITAAAITFLRNSSLIWSVVLLAALTTAHAWLWVRANYISSERDADIMYFFINHATELVLPGSIPQIKNKFPSFGKERMRWEFLKHRPIQFEILATILLGAAVIILAHAPAR